MLGARLKKIRKEKGLTLKGLAELVPASPGFISEVENGLKMPGGDFLLSLKRIFGVDLDWLLTGGESKAQASEFNTELLRQAIEVVETALEETGRVMTSHKKADLVIAIYELYAETGEQVDKTRVLKLIKSAA